MNRTTTIGLAGHTDQFRLDDPAYQRLAEYLDRASARLQDDPDRAEVLGDLERSVGDRLRSLPGSGDRMITVADIDGILEAIGSVDTGRDAHHVGSDTEPRRRRLQRVREGQEIAGVCTGIAAYAELDVEWVRTVVILGTLVTGGILGLVYIALALILPIAPRRAA